MSSLNPPSQTRTLILFFTLAFALTWAYWIPEAFFSRGLLSARVPGWLAGVAGYGPALAAVLVTALSEWRPGLRHLGNRLVRWRVGLRWYAVALLLPAATTLLALGLHGLLGGNTTVAASPPVFPIGDPAAPLWQRALLLVLLFTLGFDGLGEEVGWRGYALPRLLARRSALAASFGFGALWALWHLPYALTVGSAMAGQPFYAFLPGMFASSILYTWLFNNTRGSILLAILFHAASNTTYHLLPALVPAVGAVGTGLSTLAQWAVVGAVVAVEGPAHLSRITPKFVVGQPV